MDAPRTAAERRVSSKHDDILHAATETFLEAGYERASMDEIAAKAGVSKATVYSHFRSKEALFEAIIRELCQRLVTPLRVADAGRVSPKETLTEFARSYIELLLDPSSLALHRLLVAEATRDPELAGASYRAGGAQALRGLADYLAQETARGTLSIEDPTFAAEQLFGMLNGHLQVRALLHVEAKPPRKTLDRFIQTAIAAFLRAHGARSEAA
jgi:TetR/AcrR family transcriptional repressor of mexJK operon